MAFVKKPYWTRRWNWNTVLPGIWSLTSRTKLLRMQKLTRVKKVLVGEHPLSNGTNLGWSFRRGEMWVTRLNELENRSNISRCTDSYHRVSIGVYVVIISIHTICSRAYSNDGSSWGYSSISSLSYFTFLARKMIESLLDELDFELQSQFHSVYSSLKVHLP